MSCPAPRKTRKLQRRSARSRTTPPTPAAPTGISSASICWTPTADPGLPERSANSPSGLPGRGSASQAVRILPLFPSPAWARGRHGKKARPRKRHGPWRGNARKRRPVRKNRESIPPFPPHLQKQRLIFPENAPHVPFPSSFLRFFQFFFLFRLLLRTFSVIISM